MTERNPKAQYRRLMLIYSLAIIIPGSILSLIAFRGINNAVDLRERMRDERLARKGKDFFNEIEKDIDNCFGRLGENDISWDKPHLRLKGDSKAREMIEDELVIAAAGWKTGEPVKFLDITSLFVEDKYWQKQDFDYPGLEELNKCFELEFTDNDKNRALTKYKLLSKSTADPFIKIEAMLGEARMHLTLHQYTNARDLYRYIFETCKIPELFNQTVYEAWTGIRDIIIYWIENFTLKDNNDSPELAAIEILAFLGIPQIHMTQSNYLNAFSGVKELYDKKLSQVNQSIIDKHLIDSLFNVCNRKIIYNSITTQLCDQIIKKLKTPIDPDFERNKAYIPYYEDSVSVIRAFKYDKSHSLALIINTQKLLANNVSWLTQRSGFAKHVHWQILSEEGKVWFSDPGFNLKRDMNESIPVRLGSWTLQLQEESRNWLGMVVESGQDLYLAVFALVITVMVLGLLLTLRGITREYRLTRLKSDFISTVSHEFKSPITSIRQMSELLYRDRMRSEERKKDYYSSMLAQSERLSHLVDNILDFSRMEDGRKEYHFQVCNISSVISTVLEVLNTRYREEDFEVSLVTEGKPDPVRIDCDGMAQVFYNLLDNAVKYSSDIRKVDIKLFQIADEVCVSVKDYGIGISRRDQRRIFRRFYRSDLAAARGIKGSGIGLSIVSQIISAHNGRIELESEPGKGSRFTVFLPVYKKNNEKSSDN